MQGWYARLSFTAIAAAETPLTAESGNATVPHSRGCVFLPRFTRCPRSLANALQNVANAALLALVLGADVVWHDERERIALLSTYTNCTTYGFPRLQLTPTDRGTRTPLEIGFWKPPQIDNFTALWAPSKRGDLKRQLGDRCLGVSSNAFHGQEMWPIILKMVRSAAGGSSAISKDLVRKGAHYAFGTALRWAFAFRKPDEQLHLDDDDEFRVSVHVRHFDAPGDDAPEAETATILAIEGRVAAAVASSSLRRCAILLASDRRLTLTLFEQVATRVGCRLVLVQRGRPRPVYMREHGVDTGPVALQDVELLSTGDVLIGSWGSSFTMAIAELIAARAGRHGQRAGIPPPTITFCCDASCLEQPWPLLQRGWSVSLRSFPMVRINLEA